MDIIANFEIPKENYSFAKIERLINFFKDCISNLDGLDDDAQISWSKTQVTKDRILIMVRVPRIVLKYIISTVYRANADDFNTDENEDMLARFASYVFNTSNVSYPLTTAQLYKESA